MTRDIPKQGLLESRLIPNQSDTNTGESFFTIGSTKVGQVARPSVNQRVRSRSFRHLSRGRKLIKVLGGWTHGNSINMKNPKTLYSKDTGHRTAYKVPNCQQPKAPPRKAAVPPRSRQPSALITRSSVCARLVDNMEWHRMNAATPFYKYT